MIFKTTSRKHRVVE